MSNSLKAFLVAATAKAASELEAAYLRLPEEKRAWKPAAGARSAGNQVAECAIMNQATIEMMRHRTFPDDFANVHYQSEIARLEGDWANLQPLLHENTANVVAVLEALTDEELAGEIESPWGPLAWTEIAAYPFWNMTYHTGQINYIASLLEALD